MLKNDAGVYQCFFKLQINQISLINRQMCDLKIELNAMVSLCTFITLSLKHSMQ